MLSHPSSKTIYINIFLLAVLFFQLNALITNGYVFHFVSFCGNTKLLKYIIVYSAVQRKTTTNIRLKGLIFAK